MDTHTVNTPAQYRDVLYVSVVVYVAKLLELRIIGIMDKCPISQHVLMTDIVF